MAPGRSTLPRRPQPHGGAGDDGDDGGAGDRSWAGARKDDEGRAGPW